MNRRAQLCAMFSWAQRHGYQYYTAGSGFVAFGMSVRGSGRKHARLLAERGEEGNR